MGIFAGISPASLVIQSEPQDRKTHRGDWNSGWSRQLSVPCSAADPQRRKSFKPTNHSPKMRMRRHAIGHLARDSNRAPVLTTPELRSRRFRQPVHPCCSPVSSRLTPHGQCDERNRVHTELCSYPKVRLVPGTESHFTPGQDSSIAYCHGRVGTLICLSPSILMPRKSVRRRRAPCGCQQRCRLVGLRSVSIC